MAVPTVAQASRMNLADAQQLEKLHEQRDVLDHALHGRMPDGTPLQADRAMQPIAGQRQVPMPDIAEHRQSLRLTSRTIERATPPPYTGREKNEIASRFKKMTEKLRQGLPSHEQMARDTADHLEHHMRWEEANIHNVLAWKTYGRILDPHREFSIEHLRGHEPSHTNWRQFYQHFDTMKFADDQQRDLARRDFSPELYEKFALLRDVVETPKLIMTKLNLSQALYELCEERYQADIAQEAILQDDPEDSGEQETDESALDMQILSVIGNESGLALSAIEAEVEMDRETLKARLKHLCEAGVLQLKNRLYSAADFSEDETAAE